MAQAKIFTEKFGRLTPIEFESREGFLRGNGKMQRLIFWKCKCDCGQEVWVQREKLTSGNTQSCGCLRSEVCARKATTYVGAPTSRANKKEKSSSYIAFGTWGGMIRRCENPADAAYGNYGGRGVTVSKAWHTFENFLADMGARPTGTTLDRIDNSLGYCKENCRWATWTEQARNRRNSVHVLVDGVSMQVNDAAELLGVSRNRIIALDKKGKLRDTAKLARSLTLQGYICISTISTFTL